MDFLHTFDVMLNRIARYTWPMRILFFAVYAIVMCVQVYFKYSNIPVDCAGIDLEITVVSHVKTHPAVERSISKLNQADNLNVKVSKRYTHQTIFEIALSSLGDTQAFYNAAHSPLSNDTRLLHLHLLQSQLRGPPACC